MEKRRNRFVSTEALLPFDGAPLEPCDITRMANLKLRFSGYFRVPGGTTIALAVHGFGGTQNAV